jgi:hypothetical protein
MKSGKLALCLAQNWPHLLGPRRRHRDSGAQQLRCRRGRGSGRGERKAARRGNRAVLWQISLREAFTLLAAHYGAIKQYLDAGTNETAKNSTITAATRNAEEIAVFPAGANPNLPVDTLTAMPDAHVSQHFEEIDQLRAEAGTWEMMKEHVYMIADAMAEALAKQFPAKFT